MRSKHCHTGVPSNTNTLTDVDLVQSVLPPTYIKGKHNITSRCRFLFAMSM